MRVVAFAAVFLFVLSAFAVSKSRYEELELFNKVLYLIENKYYRDVDAKKLIEGAIKGMMDTLDPHSAYLGDEVFKKMQDDTDGKFGGLGIEVTQKDGIIYVVTPIEDSPAFKAGLKTRDRIVEINHESVLGYTLDEAIDLMKGEKNSKVHLGIVRDGEKGIQHFEMKRQIITIKSVKSSLVKKNYAYIKLIQFQRNAGKSVWEEYKKLKSQAKKKGGLKGIILDLRNNPGGLLNEAVNVTSHFVKEGIVVSTEARDPNDKDIHYVIKSMKKDLETPLVVLVNGSSASASEIVAGAIQDHKRGLVMGSQTFGKGSVQTVVPIDETKGVKLTIAQYMTPKSRKIQALGIIPDIEIDELDSEWMDEHEVQTNYIREKDLRNHLTATIETKEERQARLEEEKKERMERAARIKVRKLSKKSKKSEDIFKKKKPNEDYQVLQAIKLLKTFSFYQNKQKS